MDRAKVDKYFEQFRKLNMDQIHALEKEWKELHGGTSEVPAIIELLELLANKQNDTLY